MERGASAINDRVRAWARLGCGAAVLAVLVGQVGAEPFLDAFRRVSVGMLAVAVAVTALTTVCCAWRWCLVAGGQGERVPLRTAIAAYYRSQLLNSTLPGGVMGDAHRAVRHGRHVGQLGRSLRSVVWERTLGQTVQVVLTGVVLLVLPSPLRPPAPALLTVVGVVGLGVGVVLLTRARARGAVGRAARAAVRDLRDVLAVRRVAGGVVLASAVATMGHVAVFVVAARSTGADVSAMLVLPLAFVVLLASAVPASIAGWGPREGAAAWAFGAAGLGAAQGVTIAVLYGVMALVATLPGVAVLVLGRRLEGGARG